MKVVAVYILLDVAVELISRIRVVSTVARDRWIHYHLAGLQTCGYAADSHQVVALQNLMLKVQSEGE